MLGIGTTAGKIDDFEARFTNVNGAHFLIAGNSSEAWPITAAEAEALKSLYRRRMVVARWIRRIGLVSPILCLVIGWNLPAEAKTLRAIVGMAATILILFAMTVAIQQHPLTSWVTKWGIERRLRHRITTRMQAAVTPAITPLGRFARRLLLVSLIMELGLAALFMTFGPTIFAEWLGTQAEWPATWLVLLLGTLQKLTHAGLLFAFVLLVIDRRSRRQAAAPAAPGEKAPEGLPIASTLSSPPPPRSASVQSR